MAVYIHCKSFWRYYIILFVNVLFSGFEVDSALFVGIFMLIQLSFMTALIYNLMHKVQRLEKQVARKLESAEK